jgi:hypothetical protein
MHIKGWEGTISKNTIKTDFPVELQVHKIGYVLGNSTQYKVNILAETFEVAQNIIMKMYGGRKGFSIFEYEVARPENSIHIISEKMEKQILKALIEKHGQPEKPKGPSLMDRLVNR